MFGWVIFGFVLLMIVVAVPLPAFCGVTGAGAGFYLGYTMTGFGAGVAAGILGFFAGISIGNALAKQWMPKYRPSGEDVFSYAILVCFLGALAVGVFLPGAVVVQTWSVR